MSLSTVSILTIALLYACIFDDILYTKQCDAYRKLCKQPRSAEKRVQKSIKIQKFAKVGD